MQTEGSAKVVTDLVGKEQTLQSSRNNQGYKLKHFSFVALRFGESIKHSLTNSESK